MASYFHQAGDAIGREVQARHPADAHNWGNIIPATNWGMSGPNWDRMLRAILRNFRGSIAPAVIRPGTSFAGARLEELYKLQRRLSDSV